MSAILPHPHPDPPPEGEGEEGRFPPPEREGNRHGLCVIPPPSRGRLGGGWGICWGSISSPPFGGEQEEFHDQYL
jgi:hypothetical protein